MVGIMPQRLRYGLPHREADIRGRGGIEPLDAPDKVLVRFVKYYGFRFWHGVLILRKMRPGSCSGRAYAIRLRVRTAWTCHIIRQPHSLVARPLVVRRPALLAAPESNRAGLRPSSRRFQLLDRQTRRHQFPQRRPQAPPTNRQRKILLAGPLLYGIARPPVCEDLAKSYNF